jgi:PhnB protein
MTAQRPRSLTPHLFVRDADGAVAFYRGAFGAAELLRTRLPDGRVPFVELAVGGGRLLLSAGEEPRAGRRGAAGAAGGWRRAASWRRRRVQSAANRGRSRR